MKRSLSKFLKSMEKEILDFIGQPCYDGIVRRKDMNNKKITQEQAAELMKSTEGRIFSVTFQKKDGSERDMVCRLGVTKHLKGGELAYEPAEYDLMTVFDLQKNGYRMINLDTVKRVKVDGEEFQVL